MASDPKSRVAATAETVIATAADLYQKGQLYIHSHDHAHPGAANAQRLQVETRQQRGFSELEASLPGSIEALKAQKTGIVSTSSVLSTAGRLLGKASPRLSGIFDYLSGGTPKTRPVSDKDCVWLLDNVAYTTKPKHGTGTSTSYAAEYVVAVMSQQPNCRVVDAVSAVAEKLGLDDGSDDNVTALQTIEERIMPFLQEILPGRQVRALHGDDWRLLFSPGGRNGLSSDVRDLPDSRPGAIVPTRAQVPRGASGLLKMHTFFSAPGAGWGVISDIDDTIKRTQTSDPIGILETTFVEEPTPIKGMPELYKHLKAALGGGAPFFYLSASPYNLYPFLRDFREEHYPHGALVLRDATLMSVSGLLATLTLGTQAYKVDRMSKIHGWLPAKTFICIGDSTQSDPESYGEIYRTFPGWVGLILIRKVTDIAALGMEEKNEPDRFEKAFEGVPRDKWHVFEDADECYAIVDKVLGVAPVSAPAKHTTVDDDNIAD
ncbi:actin filament organization protein app1 [Ophiostoma piceae UAMH 11346]|uniref:Actin filament organization protein app1 n=1 Tax=Ophiostoma piceae (strain UAMH 11346) TaxID=1262450 RepID=S3CPQ3_OPHP1|nr:actin filament organization protein app1 [Ophiostoma piceae UAMH 11346]